MVVDAVVERAFDRGYDLCKQIENASTNARDLFQKSLE